MITHDALSCEGFELGAGEVVKRDLAVDSLTSLVESTRQTLCSCMFTSHLELFGPRLQGDASASQIPESSIQVFSTEVRGCARPRGLHTINALQLPVLEIGWLSFAAQLSRM